LFNEYKSTNIDSWRASRLGRWRDSEELLNLLRQWRATEFTCFTDELLSLLALLVRELKSCSMGALTRYWV
jgi:hypothetical protein